MTDEEFRERFAALTDHQRGIIVARCHGASAAHTAGELFIAPSTVRQHLLQIYERLIPRREVPAGMTGKTRPLDICRRIGRDGALRREERRSSRANIQVGHDAVVRFVDWLYEHGPEPDTMARQHLLDRYTDWTNTRG